MLNGISPLNQFMYCFAAPGAPIAAAPAAAPKPAPAPAAADAARGANAVATR